MKSIKALFVLALAVAFSAPAFAETQNVKVSGSLDAYSFYRSDYDLRGGNDAASSPAGAAAAGGLTNKSDGDSFFMSITQIEVAADLTDNVSTVINLANQRDWNADAYNAGGGGVASNTANEFDVILDLAYVKMKEIFYSPLTLTVGRQDLWFGRGFIIGNNNRAWDSQGTIAANEYSTETAFDAIRATLDFNPWTIDIAYSKITENAHDPEDDTDLWITNVNYKFAEYNAVAEGYLVNEFDRATLSTLPANSNDLDNSTNTIGGRVQFDPISQMTLGAELAYQFGKYAANVSRGSRDRDALALDVFGTYRFDNVWKPELTLEYVHFSGTDNAGSNTTENYSAWNGLYRGKFWTAYADFREFVYNTADNTGVDQPATTNSNLIQVKGSLKPMEDLLLEGSFTYLWNDEDIHTVAGNQASATLSDEIGYEWDFQATYDYTEDVSFGLLAGWFIPGDFYNSPADDVATDIVTSVKVSF